MDKNDFRLVGRIGTNYKVAKTNNGKDYVSFAVETEDRDNDSEKVERGRKQIIHVMCFKRPVIDYLTKVKAKQGNTVIVFGFISSYGKEDRGQLRISNSITAKEIYVVKTKSDEQIINENNEQ